MMISAMLASLALLTQSGAALEDPEQEARAQDLMREIRCVACENEPISQSGADIAADMRTRVRMLIEDGQSDEEVRNWFVERYGPFVVFRPDARSPTGFVLWFAPLILFALGGGLIWLRQRESVSDRAVNIEAVEADHEDANSA